MSVYPPPRIHGVNIGYLGNEFDSKPSAIFSEPLSSAIQLPILLLTGLIGLGMFKGIDGLVLNAVDIEDVARDWPSKYTEAESVA